ncbi:hypothetical protein [Maribellus maritimus]|uniref:hypothetical protein n=1 Tax=Maribellus maritimus TaxID=2870838 RepID=UPI001EEC5B62|nr:hypothetical protein [Maribellus maritimus]MCG6190009.1 hypothetical protein [Maribellus maritimus]
MLLEKKYLKLGETYLKFDFEYNESNILLIKEIILTNFSELTQLKSLKRDDLKISIEFDEGSLKTRIKFWGALITIYIGIGQYGSFRAGLREIEKDMRTLSENIIERIDHNPNINSENIIRTEKRTGLTGKLKRILNRLEYLYGNTHDLSPNQWQEEIFNLKQEISNILTLLEAQEQEQFLNEIPNELRENLPQPENRKVNFYMSKYAIKPEDIVEFIDE